MRPEIGFYAIQKTFESGCFTWNAGRGHRNLDPVSRETSGIDSNCLLAPGQGLAERLAEDPNVGFDQAESRVPSRSRSACNAAGRLDPSLAKSSSCERSSRCHCARSTLIATPKRSASKFVPDQFKSA